MFNQQKGTIFPSVSEQKPKPYWSFNDPYPQYVQVQRTQASINGTNINFKVNTFDPNTFLRSKAYIKVSVRIQKQDRTALGATVPSNYVAEDRIYKKPGMVLHNSCTNVTLKLNSHSMTFKDLRYITKKLNMSFAGKNINNNYLSTSGGCYENYNGVYNEFGDIHSRGAISGDAIINSAVAFGFDVVTPNRVSYVQATGIMTFVVNAGGAIDLINQQRFTSGDVISFVSGERFSVNLVLTSLTLNADRIDALGNVAEQDLVVGDLIRQNLLLYTSFNADDGRENSYDDAFRDINIGSDTSIFEFTEPLSFGPFNHLTDYKAPDIASKSWNSKQSPLIPYIREVGLNMDFKDISANSLIYAYGRSNLPGTTNSCQLVDHEIVSAELVFTWVKPRDELIMHLPRHVKIQSWQFEHNQFDLGLLAPGIISQNSQNNLYSQQVPSYILYYGMVDKDTPESYVCRAVNSDSDGNATDALISVNSNAVESGMQITDLTIRSNTLGGDDIIDANYNTKELYRLTLQNCVSDFPYGETKFRGMQAAQTLYSSYPSENFVLLGEQQLNSFFIREGQLQVSNVMNFNSALIPTDGYSISKNIQSGAFNSGNKEYSLHIFYIYDRFYIELNSTGFVDSKFDSTFL